MEIRIERLSEEMFPQFKKDIQEAFQKGAEDRFGKIDGDILPDSHIKHHMSDKDAVAYGAFIGDELVGGALVMIRADKHNELALLYVKKGVQSKGIGQQIWEKLEALYPDTEVWETCTPYFEKRNIHFYVNKCGFHIVEFFWEGHKEPDTFDQDLPDSEYFDGMFRFQKRMK